MSVPDARRGAPAPRAPWIALLLGLAVLVVSAVGSLSWACTADSRNGSSSFCSPAGTAQTFVLLGVSAVALVVSAATRRHRTITWITLAICIASAVAAWVTGGA